MRPKNAVPIKIAYIGGGSRYWAPTLITDLALTPQITGQLVLQDIDLPAAAHNAVEAKRIFEDPRAETSFQVSATASLSDALAGADFVILSILPGPIGMFANDLDIPLKYGVLQTVGDTTGPGGISRALRSVPIFHAFAEQIMTHCPKAWVINYTNPLTLCTAALYAAAPKIKALGCCHEVLHARMFLAQICNEVTGSLHFDSRDIAVDLAGVNHFTFFTAASQDGEDLFPLIKQHIDKPATLADRTALALENEATGHFDACPGLVQLDFFRRFGVFGAAGDRHLVEFVPWYLSSIVELHRWGVVVTPSSARLRTWRPSITRMLEVLSWYRKKLKEEKAHGLKHSIEEGVRILVALLGLRDLTTNVNFPNLGQLPALPLGAIVESNAEIQQDAIRPIMPRPLPPELAGHVARAAQVQRLTLEAALKRDKELALQALMHDPRCTLPQERLRQMLQEMLQANKEMLPGWKL